MMTLVRGSSDPEAEMMDFESRIGSGVSWSTSLLFRRAVVLCVFGDQKIARCDGERGGGG